MIKQQRAGLYVRVSTTHQTPDMQIRDAQRLVAARGWHVFKTYIDSASGAKRDRSGLQQALQDAHRGKFSILIAWSIDRVGRNVRHFLEVMDRLQDLGIQLVLVKESFDLTSALGRAMLLVRAAFAEAEREWGRERVISGLRAARERGVALGRPKANLDAEEIRVLREKGLSWRKIAREVSRLKPVEVSLWTVRSAFKKGGLRWMR